MKFLCLHGAFGNTKIFQIQLAAVLKEIGPDGPHSFKWINGSLTSAPPPGYEFYFADPPWYHFIEYQDGDYNISKLEFPKDMSPEDALRYHAKSMIAYTRGALEQALERLLRILDEDPDIDGIIGYSEGAMMAASIVLEEQRLLQTQSRPRQVKGCVFIGGWPPWKVVEGKPHAVLCDMPLDDGVAAAVDVPTFHVVGSNDPYIKGALALYNVCDEDTATLFEHGQAHNIPRDTKTVRELAVGLDEFANEAGVFRFGEGG